MDTSMRKNYKDPKNYKVVFFFNFSIEAQCGTACLPLGDCHTCKDLKQNIYFTWPNDNV